MGIWTFRMIEESVFDKRLLSLSSSSYLGYYYRNDLREITKDLLNKTGNAVTTNFDRWNLDTPGYLEIFKMWEESNFNRNAIKWTNYYPSSDFDSSLVDDVAFYLRLNGIHKSWISRVDPGFYAPWHWDVDDNEQQYLEKGAIHRYTITMCPKTLGHIFILGKDYLFNCPIGSIFKWDDYKEWHAGINAGFIPKFLLHIVGY